MLFLQATACNAVENKLLIKTERGQALGGNQEWFRALGYDDIADYGCGVVAACNLLICYLKLKYKNTDISKESFLEFAILIYKKYMNIPDIPFIKGMTGFGVTRGINRYFKYNNIALKFKWGTGYNILPKIKKSLESGLPVILGIGPEISPVYILKKILPFLKYKQKDHYKGVLITDILTGKKLWAHSHYVTVYGIIEEYSDIIMLISSWGRGYKLSYKDFTKYQKSTILGFLLSNIVE